MSYLARIRAIEAADIRPALREPIIWREHLTAMQAHTPPGGLLPATWLGLLGAALSFVEEFGNSAAALGWSASDLFSLNPEAPLYRLDHRGAAFMLLGRTPTAVTIDAIATRFGPRKTVQLVRKIPTGLPPAWEWAGAPSDELDRQEKRA